MRKIIDHVTYDPDKSKLIAVTNTDSNSERLYRTRLGHYFLAKRSTPHSPMDKLIPLNETEAIALFNKLTLKNPKLNPQKDD